MLNTFCLKTISPIRFKRQNWCALTVKVTRFHAVGLLPIVIYRTNPSHTTISHFYEWNVNCGSRQPQIRGRGLWIPFISVTWSPRYLISHWEASLAACQSGNTSLPRSITWLLNFNCQGITYCDCFFSLQWKSSTGCTEICQAARQTIHCRSRGLTLSPLDSVTGRKKNL